MSFLSRVVCLWGVVALLATAYRTDRTYETYSSDAENCAAPIATSQSAQSLSEHLAMLGVDRWLARGDRGAGVSVAVLDSGFRGYRQFLGHSLPAQVTVHSFREDGDVEGRNSQHGIHCAEVVHAIAPDAQLLLVNWEPDRPDSFIEAVRWARGQGARIMTCSLIMPEWSDGQGGGAIHGALAKALGDASSAYGPLFFASAGNLAQRHWAGTLRPDSTGYHQWRPGQIGNTLTPWGLEPVAVDVYGQAGLTCEVVVRDRESNIAVARDVITPQEKDTWSKGSVHFEPEAGHLYEVYLHSISSKVPAAHFHVVALSANLSISAAEESIVFPADGLRVQAVTAVDRTGRRASYSSCGTFAHLLKPDFAGVVPFPGVGQDRPFSGTSAASPQVAALAALWWSKHPEWRGEQITRALRETSLDLAAPGPDIETGYGLARVR